MKFEFELNSVFCCVGELLNERLAKLGDLSRFGFGSGGEVSLI